MCCFLAGIGPNGSLDETGIDANFSELHRLGNCTLTTVPLGLSRSCSKQHKSTFFLPIKLESRVFHCEVSPGKSRKSVVSE